MCLLDEVIEWSPAGIRCRTATHRSAGNPLRARGELGAACAIEYAAQAMALHGALLAPGVAPTPRAGMLASTRGVTLNVARLDDVPGELIVSASYVHGDAAMVLYGFAVSSAAAVLVTGRAAIAFRSAAQAAGSE